MSFKTTVRAFVPLPLLSLYHIALAYLGALIYRFPSKKIVVIGVTGTDGKSSTTEFINAIFETAGYKTALSNSIRVKVDARSETSTGRSMPGRFFIQRHLRRALDLGCTIAVVEMTSEGVKQHRHRAIALDCLVFTNLAPEHIESHGSYQAYADAKFEIARALLRSSKRPRIMIANADDKEGARYLALPVETRVGFSLSQHAPWSADARGGRFRFEDRDITVRLPGEFYLKNALAAAEVARAFGIDATLIERGIGKVANIPGRMEHIECGQKFSVIVDYALTPAALEGLYKTFGDRDKICVFGAAGGGRDTWKRPVLGKIAEENCRAIILTNDIAYDEPAGQILEAIASGMQRAPEIIPDRRSAIHRALRLAEQSPSPERSVVLITGMGADTEITAANGTTIPWSDSATVKEELTKMLSGAQV